MRGRLAAAVVTGATLAAIGAAAIGAAAIGAGEVGAVAAGGPAGAVAAHADRRARAAASQLIVVSAGTYGATTATLTAYDLSGGVRRLVLGPWVAWVGYNGVAPPGAKREGDGRTPSGSFGFTFMFGVDADPGVRFAYRIARPYDVWDDDPQSSRYNEWVDDRHADPGLSPESMDQSPAYDYGAVIAYNTARTPGLGSAIFLHENVGGPTAGCVSLPQGELLKVLRWLRPADQPRIEIDVEAVP